MEVTQESFFFDVVVVLLNQSCCLCIFIKKCYEEHLMCFKLIGKHCLFVVIAIIDTFLIVVFSGL